MGSFCAGRRPVLCHRLGSGLQQLHPSRCLPGWAQPGLKAGGWALPPNTHSKQSPAVGGRAAQQLLHREQHTDGYPLGSICPEPLGPPARQSSRPGLPPGPRGRELCLCRGWAAWPAPARLAGCPLRPAACAAPRGARPEVKVSVRREPGRRGRARSGRPGHSSMASSWSARSSNMLPMSSRMLPVLFSSAAGRLRTGGRAA